MDNLKKILHIDPDFNVTYFLIHQGATVKSSISTQCAVQLLKKEKLDLIRFRTAQYSNSYPS